MMMMMMMMENIPKIPTYLTLKKRTERKKEKKDANDKSWQQSRISYLPEASMYLEISIRHFVIVQRRYTDTVTCTSSIIHLNDFYLTHYLFSRLKKEKKGMGYDVTMYSAHLLHSFMETPHFLI